MSTPKSTPEELEELVRLIAKTPPRRRYVLVRRASGELAFVQDELDSMLEQAIAAAFGEPKPRRRVIKIDLPSRKPCS
jgi:RNase P/RNase MRP subunit POP5